MKLIVKIVIITLMPAMIVGCVTPKPLTPKERAEQNQQMDDLDIYMISNGHYISH